MAKKGEVNEKLNGTHSGLPQPSQTVAGLSGHQAILSLQQQQRPDQGPLFLSEAQRQHQRLLESELMSVNTLARLHILQQEATSLSGGGISTGEGAGRNGGGAMLISSAGGGPAASITATDELSFGTSAAQRQQLLSALLSESLAAQPQHPEAALARSSQGDHAQALSAVNRALQQQLLISELLRSSGVAGAAGNNNNTPSLSTLGLLQNVPVLPFPVGGNQQQQQGSSSNILDFGSMLPPPPRSMDFLRAHGAALNILGEACTRSSPSASFMQQLSLDRAAGKGIFKIAISAPTDVMGKGSISNDEEDRIQDKNGEGRMLPPRKRRKIVNFKVDHHHEGSYSGSVSSSSNSSNDTAAKDAVKATFPLPALTEVSAKKTQPNVAPKLTTYKTVWAKLNQAVTDNKSERTKEFFRRRLARGRKPLGK